MNYEEMVKYKLLHFITEQQLAAFLDDNTELYEIWSSEFQAINEQLQTLKEEQEVEHKKNCHCGNCYDSSDEAREREQA